MLPTLGCSFGLFLELTIIILLVLLQGCHLSPTNSHKPFHCSSLSPSFISHHVCRIVGHIVWLITSPPGKGHEPCGTLGRKEVNLLPVVSRSCGERWAWRCMPLTLVLRCQRQENLCEFEASLVYIVSSRTAWTWYRDPVSNKQTKKALWREAGEVVSQQISQWKQV